MEAEARAVHVPRTVNFALSVGEDGTAYRQWHVLDNRGGVELLRLRDGEVVYRTPAGGWSESIAEALVANGKDDSAALETRGLADERAQVVVSVYLMPVELEEGIPRPISQREIIRAKGPSIRTDLGKQAA